LQTFANRSTLLLAFAASLFACLCASPSARAQDTDTSAAAQIVTPYATSTTGCGTATNFGSGNVAVLYVDGLPCVPADFPDWDQPYTNVKVCAPGSTTNCQIFDHIIVDSGSDGMRLVASSVKSALLHAMPTVTTGTARAQRVVTECEVYVSSYTYGPLKTADVYIAGKIVKGFPIQMIGAPGFPVPAACSNQGPGFTETDNETSFDGNGLIGVAFSLSDTGMFFNCLSTGTGCTENTTYPGIPNLTTKFSSDNNGVVISLPSIPLSGSASPVMGALIFGVGTQTNNTPPAGTIPLFNDPSQGIFNIHAGGHTAQAYIDSGTNDLVIAGPWAICSDATQYYCPANNTPISMGLYSISGTVPQFNIGFTIGNADNLMGEGDVAYNDIAEVASSQSSLTGTFALGLATFFGRTEYFVFNGQSSKLGVGPINAMSPQK
jgi:hypothetical protein